MLENEPRKESICAADNRPCDFLVVAYEFMGGLPIARPVAADGERAYVTMKSDIVSATGERCELRFYFDAEGVEVIEGLPQRVGIYMLEFSESECEEVKV